MKTIRELGRGTSVWIEENGVLREYVVVGKHKSCIEVLRNRCCANMRMNGTQESTYESSELDSWLNDDEGFMIRFSDAVRGCIVSNSIETYGYSGTPHKISRRCYIPSRSNIFGTYMAETDERWGYIIYMLSDGGSLVGKSDVGNDCAWWLRSPSTSTAYNYVTTAGAASSSTTTSSLPYVRPVIALSPDTPVSEAPGNIILMPDESMVKQIDAICYAGSSQRRPAKARVIVGSAGLQNVTVEVTNNARDLAPAWVDATGGGEVTLANATKTSELWEIGVRLRGDADKSQGNAWYFNEPVILIEEE